MAMATAAMIPTTIPAIAPTEIPLLELLLLGVVGAGTGVGALLKEGALVVAMVGLYVSPFFKDGAMVGFILGAIVDGAYVGCLEGWEVG